ncbi:MAG: phosphoribosylanthranilate isomerase [Acidimicrobiia bacterium]
MFVKVCGTTNEEDALLAVAMGADAVGFVFAPSPRQVSMDEVGHIVHRLPREILTVGVFKDESAERVVQLVHGAGLQAAQVHGGTAEDTRWIRERVPTVFKVFAAGDPAVRRAREYGADAVLVDNPRPGSGQVFDWSLAEDVPGGLRLVLAGGLSPDNVADAIATVHPWGVDVCTGVEASPGRKDPRRVRAFVAAAREAAPAVDPDGEAATDDGEHPYDWREDG